MLRGTTATALLALLIPASAPAQTVPDYTAVGAGVRSRPAYDGSASRVVDPIPVLRYYGEPWFLRTTQGVLEAGVRTRPHAGLVAGVQLAYEEGRVRGESSFLERYGVEDIDPDGSLGAHLEWDGYLGPMPVSALVRARWHIRDELGSQADLRFNGGVYGGGRLNAVVYLEATWADARSVQSFYGITPQQSAATGLPVFDAAGGLLRTEIGMLWSFDIERAWMLVGRLAGRQLRGDARRSPLTEDATNGYVSLGLAYRF